MTGGQWSVVRALLGLTLAAVLAARSASGRLPAGGGAADVALGAAAVLAALALAAGAQDRIAAVILAGVWLSFPDAPPGGEPAHTAVALALLAHAAERTAPYGSWDARGRVDPGGGWQPRAFLAAMRWALLALAHAGLALHAWGFGLRSALVAVLFAAAFSRRLRPFAWLALGALGLVVAPGASGIDVALLQLVTLDPAWIPRRSPGAAETLFYDGTCGLCHRAVRFVLAEDASGTAFRFAPLDSDALRAAVPEAERARLPDSLVLATADGRLLTRAAGALHAAERLGGIWRGLAILARVVPGGVADRAYDAVARVRHRLFARPKDACPLLPPHLRARFRD